MGDPTRWIDEPPKSAPELRDALRRTAEVAPRPYDTKKGRERLQAGLLAATAASAVGSTVAASAAKGWLAWTAGLIGALGLGGAVYMGVAVIGDAHLEPGPSAPGARGASAAHASTAPAGEPAPGTQRPEPMALAGEPPSGVQQPEPERAAPAAEAPDGLEEPESARPVRAAPRRRRASAPVAAVAPVAPVATAPVSETSESAAPDDRLRAETTHLARVRHALDRSPAEALRLAREGRREFPAGVFAEERQALVVFALDRLGRAAEARAEAERFVARHPNGPLTSRVRAILDDR